MLYAGGRIGFQESKSVEGLRTAVAVVRPSIIEIGALQMIDVWKSDEKGKEGRRGKVELDIGIE